MDIFKCNGYSSWLKDAKECPKKHTCDRYVPCEGEPDINEYIEPLVWGTGHCFSFIPKESLNIYLVEHQCKKSMVEYYSFVCATESEEVAKALDPNGEADESLKVTLLGTSYRYTMPTIIHASVK